MPFSPIFWIKMVCSSACDGHSHPTFTCLPPQSCTPRPVSGGNQLCQSRQATHTHTHTEHIGKTKPLALPMKQSHFSMLSLSSIQSAVWRRHDSIVVASPHPKDGSFGGKGRRSWYIVDYFCLSSC